MDNLARVRHASLQVARVQRRIWLLQTLFLPVVALCGIAVALAVVRRGWRRRAAVAETSDVPLAPPLEGQSD